MIKFSEQGYQMILRFAMMTVFAYNFSYFFILQISILLCIQLHIELIVPPVILLNRNP